MREGVLHALRPDSLQQTHRPWREQVCERACSTPYDLYICLQTRFRLGFARSGT